MPELAKLRGEEYQNLRPIILLICFVWGVAMGFTLNFFRPSEVDPQTAARTLAIQNAKMSADPETAKQSSDFERRRVGTPAIAPIEPAPAPAKSARPSFEDVSIGPPAVVLTTDGGLTGRNARRPTLSGHAQAAPRAAPPVQAMPLIPDLDP